MSRTAWGASVALCGLLCGTASAAYLDDIGRKTDRGFSNALGCWLEVPYRIHRTAGEKGIARGGAQGLGEGLHLLPCRLLSGLVDIVTFPVPLPRAGWNGLMQPEYNPWVEAPDISPAELPGGDAEPAP